MGCGIGSQAGVRGTLPAPLGALEFAYFAANQNSVSEENKNRLESGIVGYHAVQNILSSSLLSESIKVKIC
jgi:hypothetical protein